MKKTVLAMVVGMLLVGPALAQNVQYGGGQQQRNTQQTTTETTEIGPDGKPIKKHVITNENLPTQSKGGYDYSGIPCKWMRGEKGARNEPAGKPAEPEKKTGWW